MYSGGAGLVKFPVLAVIARGERGKEVGSREIRGLEVGG
jgi:hypothetical protein